MNDSVSNQSESHQQWIEYLRVVFGGRASPGGGGRPSPPCFVPPAWGLTDLLSRGDWFSILSWYLHLAIRVPVQRTKEGDR